MSPAYAGGYELAFQSPEAAGAGDAATARSEAPSAAHYNPAALVDGAGIRVGIAASLALSRIDAQATPAAIEGPYRAHTVLSPSIIPALYASVARNDYMLSLAVNVPFASHVEWPADWIHRFDAVLSALTVARIAPSFGYRFGALRIAAGVHLNLGSLESRRATNHVDQEGSVRLLMNGTSVGAHLGVFAELSDHVDLGLTYQSRSRMRMRGDADFEVPLEFQARFPDQNVRADFPLPDRLALGLHVAATDEVDLYGDFSLTLWSVNDVLVIDFEEDITDDSRRVSNWKTSAALRLGADAQVLVPELRARLGFFADGLFGSPAPASTVSPTAPDSVRLGATGGFSYVASDAVTLDVYYQYLRLLPRVSTSQDAPLARYDGNAHVVGLGARFFHGMEARR